MLLDRFDRDHTYLRVSVTDRCNYRCVYCLPPDGVDWMPRKKLLSYEEVARLVRIFAELGIRRIRLSGGEPLIRRDLERLVEEIGAIEAIEEIALTTNAHRLAGCAERLARAGLSRLNVSLDALEGELFRSMTRGGDLAKVLDGIDAAVEAGLTPVKLNVVLLQDLNAEQLFPMVEYFGRRPEHFVVRFIEYMPFQARWHRGVTGSAIRERLGERYTLVRHREHLGEGPAVHWKLEELGLRLGFISPLSERFCSRCNRLRLAADGHLRTCLSDDGTPSLRKPLREGASDEDIAAAIRAMVLGKREGHEALMEGGTPFEGVMTQIGG